MISINVYSPFENRRGADADTRKDTNVCKEDADLEGLAISITEHGLSLNTLDGGMQLLVTVGLVAGSGGALITWLICRAQSGILRANLREREREVGQGRDTAGTLAADRDELRVQLTMSQHEHGRLLATLEAERQATADKIATLEQLEVRVKDAFGALTHRALQANNQTFMDLAKTVVTDLQSSAKADLATRQASIDQLVKPVQEGLRLVDAKLQAFDKERAASAATLQENLRQVAHGQQQLQGETQALVTALRAPQARGRWGEMQLKRVVELAGMQANCDFVEQDTVHTDTGDLRPDLIVRLPGNKMMVVDAKAPMLAYLDAVNATDEADRLRHLDRLAKHVRDHVTALAAKHYADQYAGAPDFVVLFLPGEAFFSAACQRDPALIDFAVGKGVIPASPTTLITVLKAVAYGWQQARIAENVEQIRDLGQELYQRVRVLADHLAKIRKGLDMAVSSYNDAVSSIEVRFLKTARQFGPLGAAQGTEIVELEPVSDTPRLPRATELVA
jgi:DNA recombination protein RmuC